MCGEARMHGMKESKKKIQAGFQEELYRIVFESDTAAGRGFDLALLVTILLSVGVVMLDSMEGFGGSRMLAVAEWVITVVFTIEYGVRIYCARRPVRYIFSFFGVVDFLSTIPTYISVLVPGGHYFLVLRVLRLLRVFRIMKMASYSREAQLLLRSLRRSRRRILVFFTFVIVLMVLLGSVMYVVEGPEHGYRSIPVSVYWAVVTMTTVGYGDISPQTALGQTLAALMMIIGYSIIAVPTGLVGAGVLQELRAGDGAVSCPVCGARGHQEDAVFCRKCGGRLNGEELNS